MGFKNTIRFLVGRLAVLGFALLFSAYARGAAPSSDGLAAWNAHIEQAKETLLAANTGSGDISLVTERNVSIQKRVRAGRILITHSAEGGMLHVPNGLIHDWIGVVYLPGVRMPDVTAALQNYASYANTYQPAVTRSELLARNQNEFQYRLKFQSNSYGVKAGLIGEFRSVYENSNPRHGYSITESTRLAELADPGAPSERELTAEESHGYIQRTFTTVQYSETDGGVYVQVEAMTLSRDIPGALRWAVAPLVERFSRQVLATTLEKFRRSVTSSRTYAQVSPSAAGFSQAVLNGTR